MSTDANDFIDVVAGEDKEPEAAPNGTYVLRIMRTKFDRTKSEKNTPFMRVNFKVEEVVETENGQEVDVDNLQRIDHDHWMSPGARYMVKRWFRDIVGVKDVDKKTYREMAEEVLGETVKAQVEIKYVGKNNDIPKAEVVKFLRPSA